MLITPNLPMEEVACAFESGDSYFHPGSSRICFVFVKWERMHRHRMLVGREGDRGLCCSFVFFVICIPQQLAYGHGLESYICVMWCTVGELALCGKVGRMTLPSHLAKRGSPVAVKVWRAKETIHKGCLQRF